MGKPRRINGEAFVFEHELNKALEAQFDNPETDIAALAESLGCSVRTLTRKVQEIYFTTPRNLLYEYRLLVAAEMLRMGYSVTRSYQESGFINASHFSNRFRVFFGICPKNFVAKRKLVNESDTSRKWKMIEGLSGSG